MELSTMITGAQQQRNATATQFDSSDFFVRRPEEYEVTLKVAVAFRCRCAPVIKVLNSMKNLDVFQSPANCHHFVFTDQICEQSGYAMTSLPVLQNHFCFLIFYFRIF